MIQRSKKRAATANRMRENVRVCIGGESEVTVGSICNVASARDSDRRSAARRRTGRKKNTIGMSMEDMPWVRSTDKGSDR